MTDRMSAAEMRARVTAMGLSLNQLSELASMDLRGVRRQANGTTPVTPKTTEAVETLEREFKRVRTAFLRAKRVELPAWSSDDAPLKRNGDPIAAGMPSSFYHAVAGSVADRVAFTYASEYGDE